MLLCGRAAGAVKFADGDFDRSRVVGGSDALLPHVGGQLEQRLNSAFAVRRGVAHDQSAPVILQSARENLRGGGAETAG